MKTIYLDHAATTPLDPRVKKEMDSIKTYANPSALHQMGLEAKEILNNARNKVAKILNAEPEEIIFTSGGTESINLAIKGIGKGHIITSKVEHPAVLETCKFLERNGCNVSYLDVDKDIAERYLTRSLNNFEISELQYNKIKQLCYKLNTITNR